MCEVFQLSDLL